MSNTRGTSLFWLLSNNRLEEVCSTLTKGTFCSRLLLSNQVKGCSPSVAHSLPLPLGPALLNLSIERGHILGSIGRKNNKNVTLIYKKNKQKTKQKNGKEQAVARVFVHQLLA